MILHDNFMKKKYDFSAIHTHSLLTHFKHRLTYKILF